MRYRTEFTEAARAEIRKLSRPVAMTILRKLTELENDPLGYNTTALVGSPDVRRLRVGDYRVFYTLDRGVLVVTVIRVGPRATIYD